MAKCNLCGAEAIKGLLCEKHRLAQNARARKYKARIRYSSTADSNKLYWRRRRAGLCTKCGTPADGSRCQKCKRRKR